MFLQSKSQYMDAHFNLNWKMLRVTLTTSQDERIMYNKSINNNSQFWHTAQLAFQTSFGLGGDDGSLLQLAHLIHCVPSVTSDLTHYVS